MLTYSQLVCYPEIQGVVDIFFFASVFRTATVEAMGDLFWKFAREMVCMRPRGDDELGYYMESPNVLPQTVICLEPRAYAYDQLNPISRELCIEGSVDSKGRVSTIFLQHELRLTASVNLSCVDVVLSGATGGSLLYVSRSQSGLDKIERAHLRNVRLFKGGACFRGVQEVVMTDVHIYDGTDAVRACNVSTLRVVSTETGPRKAPLCTNCVRAFDLHCVLDLTVERQEIESTTIIFEAVDVTNSWMRDVVCNNCVSFGEFKSKSFPRECLCVFPPRDQPHPPAPATALAFDSAEPWEMPAEQACHWPTPEEVIESWRTPIPALDAPATREDPKMDWAHGTLELELHQAPDTPAQYEAPVPFELYEVPMLACDDWGETPAKRAPDDACFRVPAKRTRNRGPSSARSRFGLVDTAPVEA